MVAIEHCEGVFKTSTAEAESSLLFPSNCLLPLICHLFSLLPFIPCSAKPFSSSLSMRSQVSGKISSSRSGSTTMTTPPTVLSILATSVTVTALCYEAFFCSVPVSFCSAWFSVVVTFLYRECVSSKHGDYT